MRNATNNSRACSLCESDLMRAQNKAQTFIYGAGEGAVEITAQVQVWSCDSCGYSATDGDAELARHEAVCRHLGLLSPTEIKQIRDVYKISQARLAELTGIGEASIKRWETGAVIQNESADTVLRLLLDRDVFRKLSQMRKSKAVSLLEPEFSRQPTEAARFAARSFELCA